MIDSISRVIPEITVHSNRAVTTSIAVATFFQKRHDDILRKLRFLDSSPSFNARNFAEVEYVDAKGEKRPAFEMTKNGFIFLVMGFTGKKAAAFKEAYIAEFDRMEAELANRQSQPPERTDGNYSIVTDFENHLPVCCRPMLPGEISATFESFLEIAKIRGMVVVPFQTLASMTATGIAGLIEDTRRSYLERLPF